LFGLLDAFFGQIPLRVGRTLGIFAINCDSMSHDVELHDFLSRVSLGSAPTTI
jgi:hypothetical protein